MRVAYLFCRGSFLPSRSYRFLNSLSCPRHRLPLPHLYAARPRPLRRLSARAGLSLGDRKAAVLTALREVIDPDLGQDIVTLGFIKELELRELPGASGRWRVDFLVELTTPACPVKEQFREECEALVRALDWVGEVEVVMGSRQVRPTEGAGALGRVGSIVAVASCKGGVGKSTTAVNLAFALRAKGAKVGLMDADIYGPSLPTMVKVEKPGVEFVDGRIRPMVLDGVKMMSFGWVNEGSAVMRGPMIGNMVNQLVSTTDWGDLDYLVIDMPPGTGDVQLTLSQVLKMTAAVIVTTPQKLAFVDVVKGLDMFSKVNVPSAAVVENMAYFVPPESGIEHYIFGKGHKEKLQNLYGIENSFSLPVDPELCEKSDGGVPYVLANPTSETAKTYSKIADAVVREVAKIQYGGLKQPTVRFDKELGELVVEMEGVATQRIWPPELRRQCRCALCVDEMTGAMKLRPEQVDEKVRPLRISPVGNYALQIAWSDGHSSLYPYSRFVDAWKSTPAQKKDPTVSPSRAKVESVPV